MKKQLAVILFLISSIGFLKSQTKNQHIIGLNIETSNMPRIINARLGANLTYIYAYKRFCIRAEGGILPGSNFGTFLKTCLNFGYTSDLNKPISVHLLGGIGGFTSDETYSHNGFEYSPLIGGLNADAGILVRPFHNERVYMGLDLMTTRYEVSPNGYIEMNLREGNTYRGLLFLFNFSVNYKLNGSKQTK
ncbi:MAG: hypothetical protein K0S26_1627 [Bacteroidota bacterium]|jgi:hypothetical protein|nr:hypothetical protein [Bacteroidota bacterium]